METLLTKNTATLSERMATKRFEVQAKIKRYTTDPLGVIQAPAAIPVSQRKNLPFHLFGEFDRQGGYAVANMVTNPHINGYYDNDIFYLATYVYGINSPFILFNPVSDLNQNLSPGDIIHLFVDSLTAPNFYHFVVISAGKHLAGFASLVSQSNISQIDDKTGFWGSFKIAVIDYIFTNRIQVKQPLFTIQTRFDGVYQKQQINPMEFYTPNYLPGVNIFTVPLGILVNQYTGLSGILDFNETELQLIFKFYI